MKNRSDVDYGKYPPSGPRKMEKDGVPIDIGVAGLPDTDSTNAPKVADFPELPKKPSQ